MVRSFSGRPVPGEALDEILASARRAPTAGNTDGWDGVILEGPAQTGLFWDATTTDEWREHSRRWPGMSRAPVVICVFAHPRSYLDRYSEPDKRRSGLGLPSSSTTGATISGERGPGGVDAWPVPFWFVDAGFAVLLMLLAATDAGLGACFLGNFRGEAELRTVLAVPSDRRYFGALLLGEPGGDDPPSASVARRRREWPDVFHRTRW